MVVVVSVATIVVVVVVVGVGKFSRILSNASTCFFAVVFRHSSPGKEAGYDLQFNENKLLGNYGYICL